MKKNRLIQWMALLLTGALLLCFAACNKGPTVEPPTEYFEYEPEETTTEPPTVPTAALGTWRIELRGVPNVLFFSSEDAQYLPKVKIEMITTNPETNLSSSNIYGGITLRSLLNYCGVQNVASVTVTSLLGPFATYNDIMAMAEDTILAWEIDGALIQDDTSPLRMCPRSGQATDFIRQVSSITVVPAAAAMDPSIDPGTGLPWVQPPMGHTSDYNYTTTTTTTWGTFPSSVPGVDAPTTETTTTTTTASTRTWTTRTYASYVGPTTTTANTAKPSWWPDGVPWPPED